MSLLSRFAGFGQLVHLDALCRSRSNGIQFQSQEQVRLLAARFFQGFGLRVLRANLSIWGDGRGILRWYGKDFEMVDQRRYRQCPQTLRSPRGTVRSRRRQSSERTLDVLVFKTQLALRPDGLDALVELVVKRVRTGHLPEMEAKTRRE